MPLMAVRGIFLYFDRFIYNRLKYTISNCAAFCLG